MKRPSCQCPCGSSTAGSLPARPAGRYRLPVTKCPGRLSKNTRSTVYPSRATRPCTTALSGVASGIGQRPSATWICRRTTRARAAHASGVAGGANGKSSRSVFGGSLRPIRDRRPRRDRPRHRERDRAQHNSERCHPPTHAGSPSTRRDSTREPSAMLHEVACASHRSALRSSWPPPCWRSAHLCAPVAPAPYAPHAPSAPSHPI